MGTNWASLLADMFLHTNEAEFPRGFLKNKDSEAQFVPIGIPLVCLKTVQTCSL
jgi:hypothetical protein